MANGQGADLRARLEELHSQSYGWALNCCGRDPAEAEDVLQTVYLKILQGKARYEGRSTLRTWLFAVIRRTAADTRRARARRRRKLATYARQLEGAEAARRREAQDDRAGLRARLEAALAELTPRQGEVVQLVFYHGLTLEEAAQVMGVSVGSARTHYHRAKGKLRGLLQHERIGS